MTGTTGLGLSLTGGGTATSHKTSYSKAKNRRDGNHHQTGSGWATGPRLKQNVPPPGSAG